MKINITFAHSLEEVPQSSICTLLCPCPEPEELIRASRESGSAIIAGPVTRSGQYGLVCAVEEKIFFQPMCFLSEGQKAVYTPGTDVEVISTPWGKLALCCEEDLFQPMYPRAAALKGCLLLSARVSAMDDALRISGPWSACQSNCLPISLAREADGELILPCAMTADGSGFGESSIDTEALQKAYREFPIFESLNKDFYRRYREVLLCSTD